MMSIRPAGPRTTSIHLATTAWLAIAGAVCCGCAPSPSDPASGSDDPPAATAAAPAAAPVMPSDRQMWEVLRIGQARVGYGRTTLRAETYQGSQVLRIEGLSRMKFSRAGETVELGVDFGSRQTPGGELLDFETVVSQGSTPIQKTRGRVVGDKLELETTTQGKTLSSSLPWKPEYGGPLASQLSLLEAPMKPGQTRLVHELIPAANVVGASQLAVADYESVDLLGQTMRLLRIDVTTTFPDGTRQQSTLWTDLSGDVLRSHEEAMNLDSFRTIKKVALANLDHAEFDLVLGLSIDVDRPLAHPYQTRRIRYRLHLDGGNPAEAFPNGPSQQVRPIDANTAEMTVYAIRPDRPGNPDFKARPGDKPGKGDLASNSLIQSDDPAIAAAAKEISAGLDDPKDTWRLAVALERFVHEKITASNYSQAFDTAAEVIQTGEGDCTEHAVLLAALARAQGIPARVAIGLVYTEQTGRPGFGYHMWNELYVDGRWIPMDATLGLGGIGAAHLKLATSDLDGASAFSSFLPVAQVAGRLRIEIEKVE